MGSFYVLSVKRIDKACDGVQTNKKMNRKMVKGDNKGINKTEILDINIFFYEETRCADFKEHFFFKLRSNIKKQ